MTDDRLGSIGWDFFGWSDFLDHEVLRPLSHFSLSWEIDWDHSSQRYRPEDGTFAELLNRLIDDICNAPIPKKYHTNEDALAEFARDRMKRPIFKRGGRWVGWDYQSILEDGSYGDVDERLLVEAVAGRVYAAIVRGQKNFDDMEESHRDMLAAIMTIILYRRADSGVFIYPEDLPEEGEDK